MLVNNACISHMTVVDDLPPEKWDAILATTLSAAFHAIRAVLPEMKRRSSGRIVNVASAHGLVATPLRSAYVAASHGVIGLTKAVALEAAGHGITCNALCPGVVRHTTVKAIAATAVFLCGEPAAAINGAVLPIDRDWAEH